MDVAIHKFKGLRYHCSGDTWGVTFKILIEDEHDHKETGDLTIFAKPLEIADVLEKAAKDLRQNIAEDERLKEKRRLKDPRNLVLKREENTINNSF